MVGKGTNDVLHGRLSPEIYRAVCYGADVLGRLFKQRDMGGDSEDNAIARKLWDKILDEDFEGGTDGEDRGAPAES